MSDLERTRRHAMANRMVNEFKAASLATPGGLMNNDKIKSEPAAPAQASGTMSTGMPNNLTELEKQRWIECDGDYIIDELLQTISKLRSAPAQPAQGDNRGGSCCCFKHPDATAIDTSRCPIHQTAQQATKIKEIP